MPRRLAELTNTARTHLTLNEVVICYASYRFALIIFKRFRLLPSKVKKTRIFYQAMDGFDWVLVNIVRYNTYNDLIPLPNEKLV